MTNSLNDVALDQLFRNARTINVWQNKPVSDEQILALYDLVKMGPTSANCCPARFHFIKSEAAKDRIKPYLMAGNVAKVMQAPVTVIIANDMSFAEKLPELFPHDLDAKNWFAEPAVAEETAVRNATLQAGYLIISARAMGLDCGPMSGFDKEAVDAEFFAGTALKSNFICSIGYGSDEGVFPRSPRLAFSDAAQIL